MFLYRMRPHPRVERSFSLPQSLWTAWCFQYLHRQVKERKHGWLAFGECEPCMTLCWVPACNLQMVLPTSESLNHTPHFTSQHTQALRGEVAYLWEVHGLLAEGPRVIFPPVRGLSPPPSLDQLMLVHSISFLTASPASVLASPGVIRVWFWQAGWHHSWWESYCGVPQQLKYSLDSSVWSCPWLPLDFSSSLPLVQLLGLSLCACACQSCLKGSPPRCVYVNSPFCSYR